MYTKGPWSVRGHSTFATRAFVRTPERDVAEAYRDDDARLIALAPDLVAALRQVDALLPGCDGDVWGEDCDENRRCPNCSMRSVIAPLLARVEGE